MYARLLLRRFGTWVGSLCFRSLDLFRKVLCPSSSVAAGNIHRIVLFFRQPNVASYLVLAFGSGVLPSNLRS